MKTCQIALPQKFFGSTQYNFNNFCVPDLYKIKGLRVVGANSIQKEKRKKRKEKIKGRSDDCLSVCGYFILCAFLSCEIKREKYGLRRFRNVKMCTV